MHTKDKPFQNKLCSLLLKDTQKTIICLLLKQYSPKVDELLKIPINILQLSDGSANDLLKVSNIKKLGTYGKASSKEITITI